MLKNHGLSAQGGNPLQRASSLEELLSWHGRDFIRCAFVTLVGRRPDVDGEAHWLFHLLEGRSRLEILWRLRRSDEGRRHDPGIRDLDRVLRRAVWMRRPVVGAIARFVFGGHERDRIEDRQARAMREALHGLAEKPVRLSEQHVGPAETPALALDAIAPASTACSPSEHFTLPNHLEPAPGLQSFFIEGRAQ